MELIKERFRLNEFEYICLTLGFNSEFDATVTATIDCALEQYGGDKEVALLSLMTGKPLSYLLTFHESDSFRLREDVLRFMLGDLDYLNLQQEIPELELYPPQKQQILKYLEGNNGLVIINAPKDSGKKTLANQVCAAMGKGGYVVSESETVENTVCICTMTDSIPIVTDIKQCGDFRPAILYIDNDDNADYDGLHVTLPPLDREKRQALWGYYGVTDTVTERYKLLPGQIARVAKAAKLSGDIPLEVARLNKKGSITRLIHPAFAMSDLILDSKTIDLLHLIKKTMLIRPKLYDESGYGRLFPYGRGIGVMFHGASGTGKTMAVQALAADLGLDVMLADISRIIDKYIGETEKHLSEIFEKAQQSNCVLFFDEADSLFAKRTEVSDSHDRSANSQTAHLLQKIEEYDGLVILATNLIDNVDDAFKRRLPFIVKFSHPDKSLRQIMWEKFIPAEMQTCDIDYEQLAKLYELTPAVIKWVAFSAAVRADGSPITMEHISESLKYEYEKIGAVFPALPIKELQL